jgi:hypothetical protein
MEFMEPLRGSVLVLISDPIIYEIPPGFKLNSDYSVVEPRSGSTNNSYVSTECCQNRGAVPSKI